MLPRERTIKEVVARIPATSDPRYGCQPEHRSIENLFDYGVIVLNKPPGPTSHQVVDSVKQILHIDKAGHSGTLDPAVTGVLVIALGKSTRVADVLLKAGKEYVCLMRVHSDVDETTIRKTTVEFVGKITQMVPKRAAVKRQLREREVYYLDILEIEGRNVLFKVGCQAGTYIRKLCVDLARAMNTQGHMQELVRTRVGHFVDTQWVTLHDLKDAYEEWKETENEIPLRKCILPIERALDPVQKIWLVDSAVDSVCHGAHLSIPGIAKLYRNIFIGDTVVLLTLKEELVGIGKARMDTEEIMSKEKGIAVEETRIFMERGTYPKFGKQKERTI